MISLQCVEVLINEYWRFENEPFYVIRFIEEDKTYLYGKTNYNSSGVIQKRNLRGYLEPSEFQIDTVNEELFKNTR